MTEDTYRGEVDDPDTLHLYAYCKNNPINYVDPSRHIWKRFDAIKKENTHKAKKCMKRYTSKENMKKINESEISGYVNSQLPYSSIKFRSSNIRDSGCGIVASHNAKRACLKKGNFLKLVTEFDYNMISSAKDGISTWALMNCLEFSGCRCKFKFSKKKFESQITKKNPGIFIAKYSSGGSHFVMAIKKGEN